MNPNFFENFQALSTLFNLTRQVQMQNSSRELPSFAPSIPQKNFVPLQPMQALHYKMPVSNPIAENKLEQGHHNELISRIYYNNIQNELIKAQMIAKSQTRNEIAPRMATPLGAIISNEMNTNVCRQQSVLSSLIY